MSIILKTQPANSVSNPAFGKRTIFFTDDGDMKIKAPDGTVAGVAELESSGNTQVVFNSSGAAGGNSGFTFNNSTGTLTVSNLTVSNTLNASNLSVSVISNGNSNVSIPSANGNITVGVSGTANVIVVSNTSVNIAGTLNVSGNINAGNIGATNAVFTNVSGNGSALSSLAGGNVTGAVAFATTANSVAGANVSGAVAFATTANSVAGGNVSGAVAFATTANSVAGGNVSGEVSFAAVANSVAGANVSGQVGNALVAGTVYTNAQPNITSVGTLTGLSVNGNITAQNITANTGVFTGNGSGLSNLAGANVSGAVAFATTANSVAGGNVTGQVGNALVAGTVYTNAQPNITSVGVLSSLSVTGNITTNANVVTDLIVGRTAGISIESAGTNQPVFLKPSGTGAVNVWGALVSNVGAPVSSTDAATKEYVDNVAQGLHTHAPCSAATPDTLANISSGTITYNNGSNGVGATLTTTGSYATIDGVNITSVGTRILVKNEANAAHNGIYTYTSGTVLTRATDFDTPTEMAGGDFTFVQNGTLYNDTGWVMTDPVTTVGTTSVNFVQFSGAGTYTAGTGLTLNGTQFSISNTAVTAATYGNGDRVASFTVNNQGQLTSASNVVIAANAANLTGTTLASNIVNSSLTSVGVLTGLSVNGNIVAANITANTGVFTGNGSGLTNLAGGNVTGQVGNSLVAGTVYTNAQPNITSVGTLTSLAVTGNVTAGNVYANSGTIGASLLTGTLTTAAQPNITSVGTLSSLAVTGNVTAGNIVGIFANGNSNISIPAANGNITFATAGSERMRLNTNGNLGIGTSSPGQKLDVYNGLISVGGSVNGKVLGYSSSNTQIMDFGVSTGTGLGTDVGIYNLVSGNITFGTNSTERMRITTSGDVGIGASPTGAVNRLDVLATSSDGRIAMRTQNTSGRADIEAQVNNYWTGPTFSGTAIFVNDSAATGNTIGINNALLGGLRFQNINNAAIYTNGATPIIFGTTGAERMRISSGGDVGIGTSSPGAKLDVTVNTVTTTYAQSWNVFNGATFQFTNVLGGDSTNGVYFGPFQSVPLRLITNNTERMRIANTGAVTINTPSSGNALTVNGNLQTTGYVSAAGYITAVPAASITSGTLTATQRGQCISASANVTVPASIFATGDTVSIYNNTSGNITIVQGASLTLRQVGTANTGNRTLAQRGFSTIWFVSATEAVISGGGLS